MRLVLGLLLWMGSATATTGWRRAQQVLEQGVRDRVYPGAVAMVGNSSSGETLFTAAVGNLTYSRGSPRMALDTVFDLASCSKVVAVTTAIAQLFGTESLDTRVADILPGYEQGGKQHVSLRHCLLHNAGLPPDPNPNYWEPSFGCAGAPLPANLSFGCTHRIYQALLEQPLSPGAVPGQVYVYSDLSFLTLMYVVGATVLERALVSATNFLPACISPIPNPGLQKQCAFEAYIRLHIFKPLGMSDTGYLPSQSQAARCAPTWPPTVEGLGPTILQGRVEDGNAYMLGGIAGHAGVFSTAPDLVRLVTAWLGNRPAVLLPGVTAEFVTQSNHSQSSRALGWNTNDITAQPDGGWDQSCGVMPSNSFTHIGYTGTQICVSSELFTVLLTNRVFESNSSNSTGIHNVRRAFNTAVVQAAGQLDKPKKY